MATQNVVQPEAVRTQLNRILQSPGLAGSPRLCRFLVYLVEQKLDGKAAGIKEYSVGLEVFDRPPSFDPKEDSIVRASARKLRAKTSTTRMAARRMRSLSRFRRAAMCPNFRPYSRFPGAGSGRPLQRPR